MEAFVREIDLLALNHNLLAEIEFPITLAFYELITNTLSQSSV